MCDHHRGLEREAPHEQRQQQGSPHDARGSSRPVRQDVHLRGFVAVHQGRVERLRVVVHLQLHHLPSGTEFLIFVCCH